MIALIFVCLCVLHAVYGAAIPPQQRPMDTDKDAEHRIDCERQARDAADDNCVKVRFVPSNEEHASRCVRDVDSACLHKRAALRKCDELLVEAGEADDYEIIDVDLEDLKCIKQRKEAQPRTSVASSLSSIWTSVMQNLADFQTSVWKFD